MSKEYSREEIIQFYKQMREKGEDGSYSLHVPTWESMMQQRPRLCLYLAQEYVDKEFNAKYPRVSSIVREGDSVPYKSKGGFWSPFLCGMCLGFVLILLGAFIGRLI